MVRPLSTTRRRRVLRVSLCACAAACALLPMAFPWNMHASAGGDVLGHAMAPATPGAMVYPPIQVERDPFARPGGSPSLAVVRAVALGDVPTALIDLDGKTQFAGVGSTIAGSSVVSITQRGVELDDGTILPLREARP